MNTAFTSFIKYFLLVMIFFIHPLYSFTQNGSIKGKVLDKKAEENLETAKVVVIGTYMGAVTDADGNFEIKDVKPGDYSIRIIYTGYAEKIHGGITVKAGEETFVEIDMSDATNVLDPVIIEGNAGNVIVDDGQSRIKFGHDEMVDMGAKDVRDLAKMQAGVSVSPDGIQVRGGRVYETRFRVDDVDAKDPLAGSGLGVDVSSGSVGDFEIITGGGDAETGNATAGVINTRIREGGDKLFINGNWNRDNLFYKPIGGASWNSDDGSIAIGGPVPFTKKKLKFFIGGDFRLTDTYFGSYAKQLHSSLFPKNDSMWAPRQDNHWANTFKLTWDVKKGLKITLTNQHTLNINQNSRTLQVVGNDVIMTPGFPYAYSLNLDNATTYTHNSNLTVLNLKALIAKTWTFSLTTGRLFTNLRGDANGRPFRETTVDQIFDPYSIVTNPVSLYHPGDSVVYVYPGPGLYNNGGIGTIWHDHFAQELTLKYKFTHQSASKVHNFTLGQEHKEQHYQWIDVTRPWVGAPIKVNDTLTTPSTSVGSSSDVWAAKPANGGFFLQDEIRYKGIIAFAGLRFDYWAPGKFVDDAVANPNAPVIDEIRTKYLEQSSALLGRRFKARLLPKLRVAFPITENNVLFFNYGHSTQLPHPRFVYAGLDPVYQDRGFLSNLGNPNLNPEVTVSYEVGLKSQINKRLLLTLTAFYNDKFDYIVTRSIIVKDQSGRYVEKTFYINQDYARIRGVELGITQSIGKMFKLYFNGGYQIATGKSNSAAESALQIKTQGFVNTTKEKYLAWDRPFDLKLTLVFKPDSAFKIFTLPLKGFRFSLSSTLKSGLRYTPYTQTGVAASGRPIYEMDTDRPYSKVGAPWFWTDFRIIRDFFPGKSNKRSLSLTFEVKNFFNNRNSQIINGVTGKAYRPGDPLPTEYRDPNYPDPQDNGVPPMNPARYLSPRQIFFGVSFSF